MGRLGSLEVRQARGLAELRAAQRLRYRIFYEQMSAIQAEKKANRRKVLRRSRLDEPRDPGTAGAADNDRDPGGHVK